jgi:hypothetical protein
LKFGSFFRSFGTAGRFRLYLALLFVLGLVLIMAPWTTLVPAWITEHLPGIVNKAGERLAEIFVETGKALLIAAVLGLVVETAEKFQFLNEFAEDISLHIMGRNLPRELRAHLEQYLGATFVRRNWDITYSLEKWNGRDDFVKLTKRTEYDMENCSEDDAEYDWQHRVDDTWYSNIAPAVITRIGKKNPETNNLFVDYREAELQRRITREDGAQRFKEVVRIPGRRTYAPNRPPVYSFIAESHECFPSIHTERFTAIYPVLNTRLEVYYNKDDFDVTVYLPLGRDAFEDRNGTELEGGKRWVIKKPILPGQSFFTTWRRRLPSATPAAHTAPAPPIPAAPAGIPPAHS